MSNPCIQCGKERIPGKTWTEKAGLTIVTRIHMLCPDKACQKLLDKAIADQKAKNDLLIQERAEAKLAREKLLAASH